MLPKSLIAEPIINAQSPIDQQFQDVKWCPETELNRRHADFQSATFPSSYERLRGNQEPDVQGTDPERGNLGTLRPAPDVGDQGAPGPCLRQGDVIAGLVVCVSPVPAVQAYADDAAIVVHHMRADLSLALTRSKLAVEVDQPVIPFWCVSRGPACATARFPRN